MINRCCSGGSRGILSSPNGLLFIAVLPFIKVLHSNTLDNMMAKDRVIITREGNKVAPEKDDGLLSQLRS